MSSFTWRLQQGGNGWGKRLGVTNEHAADRIARQKREAKRAAKREAVS